MKITNKQLRRIIREELVRLNEQESRVTTAELTQRPSPAAISDAWPQGVTHNGKNVFETFYDQPGQGVHDAEDWIAREGYNEGQEAYLGYDPDSDNFVMGFDAFYDDYDDPMNSEMEGVLVLLDPRGRALETITSVPGGMYPAGLRAARAAMPQIIDVRLD